MIEKKYGIIGSPLTHSLSPLLHNFWFKKYNVNASYRLIEIKIGQIGEIINKIKKRELQGINVTTPYKQKVIPFLDRVINEAREISSVNTIYLDNENKIVGENTDVYGFNYSFIKKLKDKDLLGKKVLILGAGGVAPAIIYALLNKQIKNIFADKKLSKKLSEELINSTEALTPEKKEFYKNIIKKLYIKWTPLIEESLNEAKKEINK